LDSSVVLGKFIDLPGDGTPKGETEEMCSWNAIRREKAKRSLETPGGY
jgi:hypothetical protein